MSIWTCGTNTYAMPRTCCTHYAANMLGMALARGATEAAMATKARTRDAGCNRGRSGNKGKRAQRTRARSSNGIAN